MELLVSKDSGMWVVHVGRYRMESPPVPLVPASENLYRLVVAIHNIYPTARVFIEPTISDNPFIYRRLFSCRLYNLTPDAAFVQAGIDNPEVKPCSLCRTRACYNPDARVWLCTNLRCGARESDKPGHFFKVRRKQREVWTSGGIDSPREYRGVTDNPQAKPGDTPDGIRGGDDGIPF